MQYWVIVDGFCECRGGLGVVGGNVSGIMLGMGIGWVLVLVPP